MVQMASVFSMRHFFVLSLALNVSFILRSVFEREQGLNWLGFESKKDQVTQRTRLSVSSSLSSITTLAEAQDSGERIINLDQ